MTLHCPQSQGHATPWGLATMSAPQSSSHSCCICICSDSSPSQPWAFAQAALPPRMTFPTPLPLCLPKMSPGTKLYFLSSGKPSFTFPKVGQVLHMGPSSPLGHAGHIALCLCPGDCTESCLLSLPLQSQGTEQRLTDAVKTRVCVCVRKWGVEVDVPIFSTHPCASLMQSICPG